VPTAHAIVATTRPGRYLTQLCRHVDQLGHHAHGSPAGQDARVTWTDTAGTIDLGWAWCTLAAEGEALTLRAEADDAADLQRLQTLLRTRLEQFGRRDHLTVAWQPVPGAEPRRPRRRVVGLAVVGTIVVAVHVALGAAAIAVPSWTGPTLDVVLAVVVVKLLVSLVLGRHVVHRRRDLSGGGRRGRRRGPCPD
jgi:hypothetical protein